MNTRLHYLGSAARIVEPLQRLAVLTCMDARVDVSPLLGLRPGDAHVIRNAGGRATDDARHALALSQAVAAVVEDVHRLRVDLHLAHRDKIRGFIYDLAANTMTEVHA